MDGACSLSWQRMTALYWREVLAPAARPSTRLTSCGCEVRPGSYSRSTTSVWSPSLAWYSVTHAKYHALPVVCGRRGGAPRVPHPGDHHPGLAAQRRLRLPESAETECCPLQSAQRGRGCPHLVVISNASSGRLVSSVPHLGVHGAQVGHLPAAVHDLAQDVHVILLLLYQRVCSTTQYTNRLVSPQLNTIIPLRKHFHEFGSSLSFLCLYKLA